MYSYLTNTCKYAHRWFMSSCKPRTSSLWLTSPNSWKLRYTVQSTMFHVSELREPFSIRQFPACRARWHCSASHAHGRQLPATFCLVWQVPVRHVTACCYDDGFAFQTLSLHITLFRFRVSTASGHGRKSGAISGRKYVQLDVLKGKSVILGRQWLIGYDIGLATFCRGFNFRPWHCPFFSEIGDRL